MKFGARCHNSVIPKQGGLYGLTGQNSGVKLDFGGFGDIEKGMKLMKTINDNHI